MAVAWSALAPVVTAAAAECRSARKREGAVLGTELADRLAAMERAAARIAEQAPLRLVREPARAGGVHLDTRVAASVGAIRADRRARLA